MGNVGQAKVASKSVMNEIQEESRIEVDPENPQVNSITKAT